jgi:hypothetical protein
MNIQSTRLTKFSPAKLSQASVQSESTFSSSQDKISDALDNLTLSAFTIGTGTLDMGMSVGYLSATQNPTFEIAGLCVGAAHLAVGAGHWFGGMDASQHGRKTTAARRASTGTGHVLTGAGHICAALGAGGWALGPIVGGMAIRALEDYKARS